MRPNKQIVVDVSIVEPNNELKSIKKMMCNSYCKFKASDLDYEQLDMICETCPLTEITSYI